MKRPLTCLLLLAAGSAFAYSGSELFVDRNLDLFVRDNWHPLVPRGSPGKRVPSPLRGGRAPSPPKSPLQASASGPPLPKSPFESVPISTSAGSAGSSGSPKAGPSTSRSLSQQFKDFGLQPGGSGFTSAQASDGPSPPPSPFTESSPKSAFRSSGRSKQSVAWANPVSSAGPPPLRVSPFEGFKQSALKRSGRDTASQGSLSLTASQGFPPGSSPPIPMMRSKSVPIPRMPSPPNSPKIGDSRGSPKLELKSSKPELRSSKPGQPRAPDPDHSAMFSGGPEFGIFAGQHYGITDYGSDAAKQLVDAHVDALIDRQNSQRSQRSP